MLLAFPKVERYTLGQSIESKALQLAELLGEASVVSGVTRTVLLIQASGKLDLLKLLIRLAFDVGAIKERGYLELQTILQEIGQQLGGWLRSTK